MHYNTVVRLEALYAGECLPMAKNCLREKLEFRERRILRKVLSAVKGGTEYRGRHIEELYKHTEKITGVIGKRRIAFYGHITRVGTKILTRRILTYFQRREVKSQWIPNTEKDVEESEITEKDMKHRNPLRDKLKNQVFRLNEKSSTNRTLSEQERKNIFEGMKAY